MALWNFTTLSIASRASPAGNLIDAIVKEIEAATSDQPDNVGATSADVLAKGGQTKERAWELFTG